MIEGHRRAPAILDEAPDLALLHVPGVPVESSGLTVLPADGAAVRTKYRVLEKSGAILALVLVLASYLTELVRILVADRAWMVARLPDDAYYYLEIAQRAGRGQGSTFDGVSRTNGFHPLWQGVLVVLDRITGGGDNLVRAALVVGLLCCVAASVAVALLIRRLLGTPAALLALLVGARALTVDGMESGVLLLTLAVLALAYARFERSRAGREAVLLGVAAGMVVLARLDFATVVWLVPLAVLWRSRVLLLAAATTASLAAVAGSWFAWSWLSFGHLLSVSGTVKQAGVSRYIDQNFGGRASLGYLRFVAGVLREYLESLWNAASSTVASGPGSLLARLLIAILALSGVAVLARRRLRLARVVDEPALAALLLGFGLIALKEVVDANESFFWIQSWYAAAGRLAAAMLCGTLVWVGSAPIRGRLGRRAWFVTALLVLLFVPTNLSGPTTSSTTKVDGSAWQGANLQAAEWINAHGPAGVYGSTDAGLLGFVTDHGGRRVVDLDGLANSYAYADALLSRAPALMRYRAQHLDFLVGRHEGEPDVPACSRVLWTSPQLVGYGGGGLDQPQMTFLPVRIWDLRPCWPAAGRT